MTLGRAGARTGALIATTTFCIVAAHGGTARACPGDCDGNAAVSVNELVRGVSIALGLAPVDQCPAFDLNADRLVQITELIAAVGRALDGCVASPTATPTPPADAEALMGAARVPVDAMQSASILDFGYVGAGDGHASAAGSARRSRRTLPLRGDSRAAAPAACRGAPPRVTCTTNGGVSERTVVYTNCATRTASGHEVVRNGRVVQRVASSTFCTDLTIPPQGSVTLELEDFSLTETDGARELARISATLTDAFVPSGTSCEDLRGGRETLSGSQSVACEPASEIVGCPGPGTDLAIDARELVFERAVSGPPCRLEITANGLLDIRNIAVGERLPVTFRGTKLTEVRDLAGATFRLDGAVDVDCLGSFVFGTRVGLAMEAQAKCPSQGLVQVSFDTPAVTAEAGGGAVIASPRLVQTATLEQSAQQTRTETAGYRQILYRADDGTIYQVLQNANANADLGAETFRITTLVGSTLRASGCTASASGSFDAEAVVGAQTAHDPELVVTSGLLAVNSPPCFDPRAEGGQGALCFGACDSQCRCRGANCTRFSRRNGSGITTGNDLPPARLVERLDACGHSGLQTYRFGQGGPTTRIGLCGNAPGDGFELPNGRSVVFAYQVAPGKFDAGSAGFPIDTDGVNPYSCPANTVLGTGRITHDLVPPPQVRYTADGGVEVSLNPASASVDARAASCEDVALVRCPLPIPTPDPGSVCPQADLGRLQSLVRRGSTAGGADRIAGASCGRGGYGSPDATFAYAAPRSGFYVIDTRGSDFDTVLSVRSGGCTGEELACSDDEAGGVQSRIGLELIEGQPIVIVVDGYSGAGGAFSLNVNFVGPATPTPSPTPTFGVVQGIRGPDLVVTRVTSLTTGVPGGQNVVEVTVANQGDSDAGGFETAFVYSDDRDIEDGDVRSGFTCAFSGLAAGDSATCGGQIPIPATLRPGAYHFGAVVDSAGVIDESDEANNTRRADAPIVLESDAWSAIGPEGGLVLSIAVDETTDPPTLYAGTAGGGVFKSVDRGVRWTPVNNGLGNTDVQAVLAAPRPAGSRILRLPVSLYAATAAGIYRSDNDGRSWRAINEGLPPRAFVLEIAVDPVSPDTLYAGTLGHGIFKSTDGGKTWQAINAGVTVSNIFSIAIDPGDPDRLYASYGSVDERTGAYRGGVLRSLDGGASWSEANTGLPRNVFVSVLRLDPADSSVLYAGYASNDGAGSVGGGLARSADGANRWFAASNGLPADSPVISLAIDPLSPGTLYAGTFGRGIFKSRNRGGSWEAVNTGFTAPVVHSLAIDPRVTATLYAGTDGDGVFKTTNGGGRWNVSNGGLTATVVLSVVIDPTDPNTMYAGSFGSGLFKTNSRGTRWDRVGLGLPSYIASVAVDPFFPSVLYAGTTGFGVYKSIDGGLVWGAINAGITSTDVRAIVIDPGNPSRVYAGAVDQGDIDGGVFRSENGGLSWQAVNSGLGDTRVQALAIDTARSATLYAGTEGGGIFRTENRGAGWQARNTGLTNTNVAVIAIHPGDGDVLFAGTRGGGIFRSLDRSASWQHLLSGLDVVAIAIDPGVPSIVYAGTGLGVFRSINLGESWEPYSSGLLNASIGSLAIDASGPTFVYSGTAGGVFVIQPSM